jgi:hypothetical protein
VYEQTFKFVARSGKITVYSNSIHQLLQQHGIRYQKVSTSGAVDAGDSVDGEDAIDVVP